MCILLIARWLETSFPKFNRHEYYTAVSYIIRLGNVRTFKIIWSSKENMVQFFRNQGQRSNTFFCYQISTRIPFSLKKDEELHIWFSLFNFLPKTSDVITKIIVLCKFMCFHKKRECFRLKTWSFSKLSIVKPLQLVQM